MAEYLVVTCNWCKRDVVDAYYPDEETPYCDWNCYDSEARWLMWGTRRWY